MAGRRLTGCIASAICAAALVGCTTHDAKFDSQVPPQALDQKALRTATARLVSAPEGRETTLPTRALAAFTAAATDQFVLSGVPSALRAANRYAAVLLNRGVAFERGTVYLGPVRGHPDQAATLEVGNALADLAVTTRRSEYQHAVVSITDAVLDPHFGLEGYQGGLIMRNNLGRSIALTALEAEFLVHAQRVTGRSTRRQVDQLMQTVSGAQVAVGRWYAYIAELVPMTLVEWGTTLSALELLPEPAAAGILGAGVPALWNATYRPDGSIRPGTLTMGQSVGLAYALRALSGYADRSYAALAIPVALKMRTRDGAWQVGRNDPYTQAVFAEGLSQIQR